MSVQADTRAPLTVEQALMAAHAQQRAGALDPARAIYERVLTLAPRHPRALTMLGTIAYQQGDEALGDAYIERAIEVLEGVAGEDAGQAAGLANLLLARGRTSEALTLLAGLELPLNPIRATPEAFAERRAGAQAAGRPAMLITTVPKSASESIWNRLAAGLGLAQSHVSIGLFPDCALVPARVRDLAAGGIIAKEHIAPTPYNLDSLRAAGIDRLVVHLRDPRQATLSWAHFVRDDVGKRPLGPIWRKIVPPARVLEAGLEAVVDWCVEHYLPRLIDFARDWAEVQAKPAGGLAVRCLSFEQYVANEAAYLREVLDLYDLDQAGFAAETRAETVHWRKGETAEWRSVFTAAQRRRAQRQMPAGLAGRFGWDG